jgi:hypothetical protein
MHISRVPECVLLLGKAKGLPFQETKGLVFVLQKHFGSKDFHTPTAHSF